jgi:hypothetical protein
MQVQMYHIRENRSYELEHEHLHEKPIFILLFPSSLSSEVSLRAYNFVRAFTDRVHFVISGSIVVEALCYKPEARGIASR